MKDKTVLGELLLTKAALTVRNEFCIHIEEAGGLKFIRDGMVFGIESLSKQCNFVKCLCFIIPL